MTGATTTHTLTRIEGGIGAPAGFTSGAVHCGIKRKPGVLDLLVLATDAPATAAGLFTTNLTVAAPVLVSRRHLAESGGMARAIVVNSGCANACTGETGMADARRMAAETAAALGCADAEVLVASTGVIGVNLDMARVVPGIHAAAGSLAAGRGLDAARAIMTTDLGPKECAVRVESPAGAFAIGGMAKGAGMIEPNMATMLGFLATDAAVPVPLLRRALREAVDDTFNAITVDGERSTNDSVFLLASGGSGVTIDAQTYPLLVDALRDVAGELARAIVRGGEGATKLIAVHIADAACVEDARQVARTIANSPLVKTAVHGADPNWGRIVSATGRAGVPLDIQQVEVRIGGVLLFERGRPHDDASPLAEQHLLGTDISIDVDLGTGGGAGATIWTCDLSAEYVRINGEYRT
jgi:glutamate N-acetyltransferase/amino-acid N-acetyltransferase